MGGDFIKSISIKDVVFSHTGAGSQRIVCNRRIIMKRLMVVSLVLVTTCVLASISGAKYFLCKNCGTKFGSVQSLTASLCQRNPNGYGRHELYEGTIKPSYTCKYCGQRSNDMKSLTSSKCQRHPSGPAKGYHSPAL